MRKSRKTEHIKKKSRARGPSETFRGIEWDTIKALFEQFITFAAVAKVLDLPYNELRKFVVKDARRYSFYENNWAEQQSERRRARWRRNKAREVKITPEERLEKRRFSAYLARTIRLERKRLEREGSNASLGAAQPEMASIVNDLDSAEIAPARPARPKHPSK